MTMERHRLAVLQWRHTDCAQASALKVDEANLNRSKTGGGEKYTRADSHREARAAFTHAIDAADSFTGFTHRIHASPTQTVQARNIAFRIDLQTRRK